MADRPGEAAPPGPLVGMGRAADVYDVGDGRVLRRYRGGRSAEDEFAVMRWMRDAGYPVPQVVSVDGADLVMERLEGRTMLDALGAAPWKVGALARQLADLHRRLAEVTLAELPIDVAHHLPTRFTPTDGGVADEPLVITHLDLHPDNVMLTPGGPVVFDWSNTCLAPHGADVTMTWLLMSTSEAEVSPWLRPIVGRVRSHLVRTFVSASGGLPDRELVRRIVEHRLDDPNVLPIEAERLRAIRAG